MEYGFIILRLSQQPTWFEYHNTLVDSTLIILFAEMLKFSEKYIFFSKEQIILEYSTFQH
jgi:hypothetical protein